MSAITRDEQRIRLKAFEWLSEQVSIYGDVLPRALLAQGFEYNGTRIPLVSPQGIFKPRVLRSIPLSITTTIHGPYSDSFNKDGLLQYKYRGVNPDHRDNVGLKLAAKHGIPLIYFHAIMKGKYLAVWPVYIVGADDTNLTFTVAVDDVQFVNQETHADWATLRTADSTVDDARRQYITSSVRQRLHQRSFRERVLQAYRGQCAFCRLKHEELLDAAHIIPDNEPEGDPLVTNGMALCKLHHAAFDKYFLGVRPDYSIEVRPDILLEHDGPMLQHGLKELHEKIIVLPRKKIHRPNPKLLDQRYLMFKKAG
ncbi:HNH endonuclease [Thermodesulfobacteriota bacterium]